MQDNNTISLKDLEKLLTKKLNELADRDQETREEKQKRRLRECNKYYLPEDKYRWGKTKGKRCIIDREWNRYTDIEETIREIEKAVGLR